MTLSTTTRVIFIFLISCIFNACTSDSDLFNEVANERTNEGLENRNTDGLEQFNVVFSPTNDAYLQNGNGHNDAIIRLEQDRRMSFLSFDLSPLAEIEGIGIIQDITLQLQVQLDEGTGTIEVHKGLGIDWTEENLNQNNAAEQDIRLGAVSGDFEIGDLTEIQISSSDILKQDVSLILSHTGANDVAFASKEFSGQSGPVLAVTYFAPPGTPAIEVVDTEENDVNDNDTDTTDSPNASLAYWKDLFDDQWVEEDMASALSKANSKNLNQEYYFMSYYLQGLRSMWQATGDNSYLDSYLLLVGITIDDATDLGNGFSGWPAFDGNQYALWDSFYWREVATLLRILHQSPNLRAAGYQNQFDELLAFSEQHIWNRYEAMGTGPFYRSRTHMASHWARIGMELYVITRSARYLDVFERISFGEMIGRPSNLRNELNANPSNPTAVTWNQQWGFSTGERIQDVSHANQVVSFITEAYINNIHWTKEDVDALTATLTEVVWPDNSPNNASFVNVDGSGGIDLYGRLNEWLVLGQFDAELQEKIRTRYTGRHLSFFPTQTFGIAALNAVILEEGAAVYPENP